MENRSRYVRRTACAVILLLLVTCAVLPAGAERKNAGAVTLEVPAGWKLAESDGALTLTPPGLPSGALCKVVLLPAEATPFSNFPRWFDGAWRALKARYGDIQEAPVQAGSRNGQTTALIAASMSDSGGHFVYVSFSAIWKTDRVQPLLFIAGNADLYARHKDVYSTLINSVAITGEPLRAGTPLAADGWGKVLGEATDVGAAPVAPRGTATNLVGEWGNSGVRVSAFRDPRTGGLADPPGNVEAWSFVADGSYAHGTCLQTMMGMCRLTLIAWNEGTWSADGSTLVARPRRALVRSINTCGSSDGNYERQTQAETQHLSYRLEQSANGAVLVLRGSKGEFRARRQ